MCVLRSLIAIANCHPQQKARQPYLQALGQLPPLARRDASGHPDSTESVHADGGATVVAVCDSWLHYYRPSPLKPLPPTRASYVPLRAMLHRHPSRHPAVRPMSTGAYRLCYRPVPTDVRCAWQFSLMEMPCSVIHGQARLSDVSACMQTVLRTWTPRSEAIRLCRLCA